MSEMTPKERAMKEAIRIVANPQRSAHAAADIIEAAITEAVSAAKAEMELQVVEMRERCALVCAARLTAINERAKAGMTLMERNEWKPAAEALAGATAEIRALPIPTIEAVEVVGRLVEACKGIDGDCPDVITPRRWSEFQDALAAARKRFGNGCET